MRTISEQRCFGGVQGIYEHDSDVTKTAMRFAVFTPPQAGTGKSPVVWFLSGLTCTEENFTVKAGAQRKAAELGLTLIAPDTSPRGAGIGGEDDDYDLGTGAGFYVDATQPPWNSHYQMYSYVTQELPELIFNQFSADKHRQGIMGHSMGGHGALTIALKNPDVYHSVSAFSPICAPSHCPWGEKALSAYIGESKTNWAQWDANELVLSGRKTHSEILIDQGQADNFLAEQLHPQLFQESCQKMAQPLSLRFHAAYDHSYFFIASFIDDHLIHHARLLR
ncbi:MAG: S-formylglutathione hydrolase [Proteobacteria bacterium]|nr:S-formylglutathione hydrolase [Pseudomonadota bacterium]